MGHRLDRRSTRFQAPQTVTQPVTAGDRCDWVGRAPSGEIDRLLMRDITRGDQDAFAALFDKYESIALWKAFRVLRSLDLAEEAVQEAFLAVWRDPRAYRTDGGTVRVWLMSLVRHRAIDAVRHEHALASRTRLDSTDVSNQQPPVDPGEQVPANSHKAEQRQRLHEALGSLSPKQSAVVDLMYYGELTQQRVAEHLKLPLGTVKSRSQLALRNLRMALSGIDR